MDSSRARRTQEVRDVLDVTMLERDGELLDSAKEVTFAEGKTANIIGTPSFGEDVARALGGAGIGITPDVLAIAINWTVERFADTEGAE